MTVLDWMREHPHLTSQIEIRRFIAFGVIHRILLRIHCYPYLSQDDGVAELNGNNNLDFSNRIGRLLDGAHHLDDIGTRFQLDKKQLLEALAEKVHLIWK